MEKNLFLFILISLPANFSGHALVFIFWFIIPCLSFLYCLWFWGSLEPDSLPHIQHIHYLFLHVYQWQPGSVLPVVPKARRQGVRCCHSLGQGLFQHHVIVFVSFRVAAREYGLLSPDAPAEKESWSVSLPSLHAPQKCKRVHKNSSEATTRQRGGWWAALFVLPFGMVGLALQAGISPEHEHPKHWEPLLSSKSQELRTALLLL